MTFKPGGKILNLREQGFEVRVTHRRPHLDSQGRLLTRFQAKKQGLATARFAQTGGITSVTLTRDDHLITADAVCRKTESFNRGLGTEIALGRALKLAQQEGLL